MFTLTVPGLIAVVGGVALWVSILCGRWRWDSWGNPSNTTRVVVAMIASMLIALGVWLPPYLVGILGLVELFALLVVCFGCFCAVCEGR